MGKPTAGQAARLPRLLEGRSIRRRHIRRLLQYLHRWRRHLCHLWWRAAPDEPPARVATGVDEWKLRATRPDNHWLDCLVGCAVAASIQGASLPGVSDGASRPRKRIKLSQLQRSR